MRIDLFLEKSPVYGSKNGGILEDNLQKMEVLNSGGPSSNASPLSPPTLILSPSSRVPPKSSSSISSIFEPLSPISVLSKPSEAMMSSTESSGEYIFNTASSEYSLPDFNLCGVLSLTLLILPGISLIYPPLLLDFTRYITDLSPPSY